MEKCAFGAKFSFGHANCPLLTWVHLDHLPHSYADHCEQKNGYKRHNTRSLHHSKKPNFQVSMAFVNLIYWPHQPYINVILTGLLLQNYFYMYFPITFDVGYCFSCCQIITNLTASGYFTSRPRTEVKNLPLVEIDSCSAS